MSIDKSIVKMDKMNSVVVGFKINCASMITDYTKELIEDLCYHGMTQAIMGDGKEPQEIEDFAWENVSGALERAVRNEFKNAMKKIIKEKTPAEISKEISKRCFGENE